MPKVIFNEDEIKRFINEFSSFEVDPPTEYILHFFKIKEATVSIYKSGAVLFQGGNLEMFKDYLKLDSIDDNSQDIIYDDYNVIGADEVGTGDLFGPIVCASVFVSKDQVNELKELGVKDSKALDDNKIIELATKIIKSFKHQASICRNEVYNDNIDKINLNKMKAKLHDLNIRSLVKRCDYDYVVLDEFASKDKYFEYLDDKGFKDISFEFRGESKSIAVAASSIVARYYFLKEFDRLKRDYGYDFPKGSGDIANRMIDIIRSDSKEGIFYHTAKLNFKNFKK